VYPRISETGPEESPKTIYLTYATQLHYTFPMKNFSDFEAKLRLSGRRLTPLRRELLCVLEDAARPLPAMRLLSLLEKRGRTVNKTTIYRELDLFEDLGMVQAFDLGGRE